ncbi:prepilin-type N-terminal cleavage/methylation domain-containing protein [Nocardioides ungokensis]|uniref:pilus assembly FimT family protein n=1 Tax=Nocardioides ungokensis TaxID=1643322 RepID=UPI0015DEAF5F
MSLSRRDSGFTLIEIMVVVALVSLMSALGVGAYKSWALAHAQLGAATDLQTILRQTQVRAVTEGFAFCVKFDTQRPRPTPSIAMRARPRAMSR